MSEREEFEAWARDAPYYSAQIQCAWAAWQAARAAPAQPVAIPREPTVAMLQVNVINGAATHHAGRDVLCSGCLLGDVWRAMYDAAPASQERAQEPGADK